MPINTLHKTPRALAPHLSGGWEDELQENVSYAADLGRDLEECRAELSQAFGHSMVTPQNLAAAPDARKAELGDGAIH